MEDHNTLSLPGKRREGKLILHLIDQFFRVVGLGLPTSRQQTRDDTSVETETRTTREKTFEPTRLEEQETRVLPSVVSIQLERPRTLHRMSVCERVRG